MIRACKTVRLVLIFFLSSIGAAQNNGPIPAVPSASELEPLYKRGLALPNIKPGDRCPITSERYVGIVPDDIFCADTCPWFGNGPVHFGLTHFDKRTNTINLTGAPRDDNGFDIKTAWVSEADYSGPILVRGRRLDDGHRLAFSLEGKNLPDLQLLPPNRKGSSQWSFWPSALVFSEPGCYGIQIDWPQGSEAIVLLASGDATAHK